MRLVFVASVIALAYAAPAFAAVPAGFTEERYSSNTLSSVTGAAWAPDGSGRLFVLTKNGPIRIVRTAEGRPLTTPGTSTLATSLFQTESPVHTGSESGVLGLAFDPNYVVNRYVYVFVSVSASEQQIVRYTDSGGGVDAPGSGIDRTVILPNLPSAGQNHVGGSLAIGADGKLYFGIGDLGNGTGVNADLTSLASKIGRANLDGSPPGDNPFNDGVGPNNEYIWARGFRNPFGLVRQPSSGKLWTNVAGTAYEQAFLLEPGAHGGYNTYENNQPKEYLAPKIAYRTNSVDQRTIASATRAGGTLTITTPGAHGFRVGQPLDLAGLGDASFNGTVYVRSVPTPTSFTTSQGGADAVTNGGSATTRALGGSITRGTFYEATAFPPEYRGNFFFGDYNTGQLTRAVLSGANEVESVDEWGTGFAQNIQVATGDDGALYTLGFTGGILRRIVPATPLPKLIVGNRTLHVPEGGRAAFTVALATAPAADLTVTVARSNGDTDLSVVSGGTLTFTPTDWAQPRAVVLAAARDADIVPDVTSFDVSAPGLSTERVVATSIESSDPYLVLSKDTLQVPEGGQATITVAWSAPLSKPVTVTLSRIGGDSDVTIEPPTTLSFTPGNAQTPQTVTIAAAEDADDVAGRAQIALASSLGSALLEVTEVDDEAPPPDAGAEAGVEDAAVADARAPDSSAPTDASSPSPSPPDGSTEPSDDGSGGESDDGCNCNVHGGGSSGAFGLLIGLLLLRRRRSR